MAKKTQAQRIQEAADFVENEADKLLGDDDAPVEDEFEINDPDEELDGEIVMTIDIADIQKEMSTEEAAQNLADAADAYLERQTEAALETNKTSTPEAAETLALIDHAVESEAVEDWNAVAERIYWLDHIKHQTPALKASKLARILERLP